MHPPHCKAFMAAVMLMPRSRLYTVKCSITAAYLENSLLSYSVAVAASVLYSFYYISRVSCRCSGMQILRHISGILVLFLYAHDNIL